MRSTGDSTCGALQFFAQPKYRAASLSALKSEISNLKFIPPAPSPSAAALPKRNWTKLSLVLCALDTHSYDRDKAALAHFDGLRLKYPRRLRRFAAIDAAPPRH